MSIFGDLKAAWNKEYEESEDPTDKVVALIAAVAFGLVGLFVIITLLSLVWLMVKILFAPALIALAVYGAGAYFLGWPLPKFIKKFVK